jgi:uncharacterized protein YidB (DUF937 family)
MRLNKRMLIAGLAGILAIGALGAGVVAAQEPGGERPGPTSELRHHRPALKGLKAIFEASGLEREVFAAGFAEGLTVGEVLEANGLDPQVVVADALAIIAERVEQAVADGVIDEARGAQIMANAEEGLQALLDVTPEKPHRPGPGVIRHHFLGIVAETIGITPAELREDLSDGDTIAQVAESYGVDPQAVIDAVLAPLFERIDQAEANGRLTPGEAAEKKAAATERVTNIVFNGPASDQTP